jgi:hypothetical protein
VPRARAGGTEPGEDKAGKPEQERRDAVLDVVMVRPRLVARKPGRQRMRRLGPIDTRKRDQRKTDDHGEPNEKTAALHEAQAYGLSPTVVDSSECNATPPRLCRCDRIHRPPLSEPGPEYERATRGPLFRSPSRSRFRPPAPLTFGFRLLPSLPASTYLRSVLGARRNLGEVKAFRKRSERGKERNLHGFNYPHFHSRPCSLWKRPRPAWLESRTCRTCLVRPRSTAA